MSYKFNPLVKSKFDYYESDFLGVLADAPTGSNGQTYINSGDNTLYIYWGSWQSTGITLTPPAPSAGTRYASLWFLFGNVH